MLRITCTRQTPQSLFAPTSGPSTPSIANSPHTPPLSSSAPVDTLAPLPTLGLPARCSHGQCHTPCAMRYTTLHIGTLPLPLSLRATQRTPNGARLASGHSTGTCARTPSPCWPMYPVQCLQRHSSSVAVSLVTRPHTLAHTRPSLPTTAALLLPKYYFSSQPTFSHETLPFFFFPTFFLPASTVSLVLDTLLSQPSSTRLLNRSIARIAQKRSLASSYSLSLLSLPRVSQFPSSRPSLRRGWRPSSRAAQAIQSRG